MAKVIPLHRGFVANGCDDDCQHGARPCECGIGALTEADVDRHIAERYEFERLPRTLAEAFPQEHANPITHYRRPSFLRQAANAIRAAWRTTLEGTR
ncbi:hypothetical protein [Aquincola tertiaricarbonis]|uniref:hypothetical protein n=1 Tax=Aquincola tertiaricarbonis TaxID=391953 RepID=UPI000614E802|nr:hypothetical protein [Aquincola tertiaricarbonis]